MTATIHPREHKTQPQTLNRVLQKYGPEIKHEISLILAEFDLPVTDPLAAVIAALYVANLENLKQLAQMPESFQDKVKDEVERFGQLSATLTEHVRGIMATKNYELSKDLSGALTKAVEQAVVRHCKKIERINTREFWVKMGWPMLGAIITLLFSGGLIGSSGILWWVSQGGKAKILSEQDIAALLWVKTEEGQLAQNLSQWNPGLAQQCQEQIEVLNGKCPMWVIPPSLR